MINTAVSSTTHGQDFLTQASIRVQIQPLPHLPEHGESIDNGTDSR